MHRDPVRWGSCLAVSLLMAVCAGCPQYRDPTVPGEVRRVREPQLGEDYYLYVPTTYDASKKWALVVICHGTRMFDSARRQMGDWAKLAEEERFIVIAPMLRGVNSAFPPRLRRQLERQRADERHLLACVRHVRGAYRIADDRIFLTGWSGGGYAVLYTGLKHPEIFRALASLQGSFRADFLAETVESIDPFQPVYVLYGSTDVLTGREGRRCADWLSDHGAAVTREEVGGAHKNHPKRAYQFFVRVARKVPWLHIRAFAEHPGDPMTIRFKIRASFEPQRYAWSFGDGQTSPVSSPLHTYAREGLYTVALEADTADGVAVRRAIELPLPQQRLPDKL